MGIDWGIDLGIIGTLSFVVFAITAVLIITLILLQDEQGEGFGGLFGGGGTTPFGAVGGSVLVKATSIFGVLFMLSSLGVAIAYKSGVTDNVIGESRATRGIEQNWFLEPSEQPEQPEEPEQSGEP